MYGNIPRDAYPGRDNGRFANVTNRETGKRTKVSAIIVYHGDKPVIEEVLRRELIAEFGGYTMSPAIGGWQDPDTREIMEEVSRSYSVSFKPDPLKAQRAIDLFTHAAHKLGEKWLHVEVTEFQCEHRKVND